MGTASLATRSITDCPIMRVMLRVYTVGIAVVGYVVVAHLAAYGRSLGGADIYLYIDKIPYEY